MGLFSFVDNLLFDGADTSGLDRGTRSEAGLEGARDVERFNQQGIDALAKSLGITTEQLLPFIQASQQQIDPLQRQLTSLEQGATPEGFDERLGKIFSSESFGNLRDQRARDIEGILSAGGQVRSGKAVQDFANLSPELGFSIENLLTGRSQNLADRLGGRVDQGANLTANLGNLRAGTTGSIADLFSRTGEAFQSGRISDADRELNRLLGFAGLDTQAIIQQDRGQRQTFGNFLDFFSPSAPPPVPA